jgi:hypothetical protein
LSEALGTRLSLALITTSSEGEEEEEEEALFVGLAISSLSWTFVPDTGGPALANPQIVMAAIAVSETIFVRFHFLIPSKDYLISNDRQLSG